MKQVDTRQDNMKEHQVLECAFHPGSTAPTTDCPMRALVARSGCARGWSVCSILPGKPRQLVRLRFRRGRHRCLYRESAPSITLVEKVFAKARVNDVQTIERGDSSTASCTSKQGAASVHPPKPSLSFSRLAQRGPRPRRVLCDLLFRGVPATCGGTLSSDLEQYNRSPLVAHQIYATSRMRSTCRFRHALESGHLTRFPCLRARLVQSLWRKLCGDP